LRFWDQKPTDYKIPSYYADSAFGRNVEPARKRLLDGKYLEISSVEKSIDLKKVPELKELLAARGLKVSGKKAELIQRLVDNVPRNELETMFPIRVYEITDTGKEALNYYSIIFANEYHSLSLSAYRLLKEKETHPTLADEEILLQVLLQDLDRMDKQGRHELYRITAGRTADFLLKISQTNKAFGMYCVVFFLLWYQDSITPEIDKPFEIYIYQATAIDHCGLLCNYSLNEMLTQFRSAVQEINPFGLGTKPNIDLAIKKFKEALSI